MAPVVDGGTAELQAIDLILGSEGPQAVFNDRFIGDKYCERIAHKLRNDLVKTDVQLRGNYIGCQGAVAIADMLRVNGTIRSLSLEWNDIGTYDLAMAALAGALEVNRTLRVLDLRNNHVSPDGAMLLARALKVNDALEILDLRWNEVGDAGAEAVFHVLGSGNRTLKDVRLAGNKVGEALLGKVDSRLQLNQQEREGAAGGRPKADGQATIQELQLTRSRIAELEGELAQRRQDEGKAAETASLQKLQEDKESAVLQLESSAARVVALEHELLVEKGTVAELRARLEAESLARAKVEDLLKDAKAQAEEAAAKEARQQATLQALHEERRGLHLSLKECKTAADEQVHKARASEREREVDLAAAKEETAKLVQSLRTAEATIMQMRGKLGLLAGQLDEERAAVERIQDNTRVQLEEMRSTYEERLKALKQDLERRAKLAEDRLSDCESERRRVVAAKEALQRGVTKAQLEVEERLSEQERRIRHEVESRRDAEAQELIDRIDALTKARELQEAQATMQSASLEELKVRMAGDLKEHSKALRELRVEVERAREEARQNEAKVNKYQVEMLTHEQKLSMLLLQKSELEKDRARLEGCQQEAMAMVKHAYDNDRRQLVAEVEKGRRRCQSLEEQLQQARASLSLSQQQAQRSLSTLERDVVAFVQQACAAELGKQQTTTASSSRASSSKASSSSTTHRGATTTALSATKPHQLQQQQRQGQGRVEEEEGSEEDLEGSASYEEAEEEEAGRAPPPATTNNRLYA